MPILSRARDCMSNPAAFDPDRKPAYPLSRGACEGVVRVSVCGCVVVGARVCGVCVVGVLHCLSRHASSPISAHFGRKPAYLLCKGACEGVVRVVVCWCAFVDVLVRIPVYVTRSCACSMVVLFVI